MKNLIVISAPSGSGKTTLCRALQASDPEIRFSISYTTRPARHTERNGVDYHFIGQEEFTSRQENKEFVECELVHGYYYGTSRLSIEGAIENDALLLLEVDVKGAMAIKEAYFNETMTFFILPPSVSDLKNRLRNRGTDSEERINKRLERLKMELDFKTKFEFNIINDDVTRALSELNSIIQAQNEGVLNGT